MPELLFKDYFLHWRSFSTRCLFGYRLTRRPGRSVIFGTVYLGVVQGMIRYASVMLRRVGVGWGYSRLCGLRDGCDATCSGVGGVGLMTFLCFASWV